MLFDIGSRVTAHFFSGKFGKQIEGRVSSIRHENGVIVGWYYQGSSNPPKAVVVLDNSERIVIPLSNLDEVR